MAVRQTISIDVSALPADLHGHKATLWWGIICLIAIEGMGFALAIAAYFYLRLQEAQWPPAGWAPPSLVYGSINLALIVISAWPMRRVDVAGQKVDEAASRFWITVWLLMGVLILSVRALEYAHLNVKWDSNAYGSIVWIALSLHALHLVSAFGETAVLAVYIFTHPLDRARGLDLHVDAVYWYFIVIPWIVLYVILYLGPWMLN